MDRGLRDQDQESMVNGTNRIDFAGDFRDHTVPVRPLRSFHQFSEEGLGYASSAPSKRGIEAVQRPTIFNFIGGHGKANMSVFFRRTDQRDISRRGPDSGVDFFDHRHFTQGQQSLIAAHTPAGAAHQHEPCPISAASHEMILATSGLIVLSNKKVYICFLMAFAMLAASPVRAAEADSAITAPPPAVHKTHIVRADPRTGKLVRSVVVSSRPVISKIAPQMSASAADLNAIVDKAARAHEVDPLLIHSIIKVESNYNVHAVSNKGAEGLMQLTPSTARMLGVSNSFDPQQNIEAGVKYLKYLKDLYKDDRLALAAYNAGPGAVDKYKWIPPYAETQNYVYQVGKRYGEARRAADATKPAEVKTPEVKASEVKAVDATPAEIPPAPVKTFIDENGRLHLRTTQ
jgi:soluble lytic murein transglycosylase-like protein